MGTYRAIKVIYRRSFENARPYEREFKGIQKFEPVSRSHEGMVDILHVGRPEGDECFYYVMELADDALGGADLDPQTYTPKTLREEMKRRGARPAAEALDLAIGLSRALEHLHSQGLIHRDIKPANIVFIGGVPKLADIGLVTAIGEDQTIVGTDGYLSPEGPGSPPADLYSLGKVLYEICTGKDRREFPADGRVARGRSPEAWL
jgi:serine/threonine protein kinase